jgi:hypothetical protein
MSNAFIDTTSNSFTDTSNNKWKTSIFTITTYELRADLQVVYSLLIGILSTSIEIRYNLLDKFITYIDIKYGMVLSIYLALYYGDVPQIRSYLDVRYKNSPVLKAILSISYEDISMLRSYLDVSYRIPKSLISSFEIKYNISEKQLRSYLDLVYDISTNEKLIAELTLIYNLKEATVVRRFSHSLTINGNNIPISSISGSVSIDNFVIGIDVQLTSKIDYYNIKIDQAAVLNIQSDTYVLIVDDKHRNRPKVGVTEYWMSLSSPRIDLQSPRADLITEDYAPGNAHDISESIAGVPIDWQIIDFPVLADKLSASDEVPIEIIRKITKSIGAKIQSNKDGSLRVIYQYPKAVNNWLVPEYYLTDSEDFTQQNESFVHNTGFNMFDISDSDSGKGKEWTEQERINDYKYYVYAYQVPWNDDDAFFLIHSGGLPVPAPVSLGVKTRTIETQIEFKSGKASVNLPIYSDFIVEWLREDLGTVNWKESGELTVDNVTGPTQGYSLAKVTYTTKYRLWTVEDLVDEDVQYLLDKE